MKEIYGDLFEQRANGTCITTNGYVKSNGEAVMGRGCAKEAAAMIPELPSILGRLIRQNGNCVNMLMGGKGHYLFSFPVKAISEPVEDRQENVVTHMRRKFQNGICQGWACKARLEIIEKSAYQILAYADKLELERIVIPRPGCGAGELSWGEVKPILEWILDDRFEIITFAK